MATLHGNPQLRHKLFTITEYEEPSFQEQKIPRLVSRYPEAHVRVLPNPFALPIVEFNCVAYALDLVGRFEPTVIPTGGTQARYAADTNLLALAIEQGLLQEIAFAQATSNDLAVYFEGAKVRHVAKYLADGVYLSKWGARLLCEHGLWDLPKTHGDEVRYFRMPQVGQMLSFLAQQVPGVRVLN